METPKITQPLLDKKISMDSDFRNLIIESA
jgi:hypothetical protein